MPNKVNRIILDTNLWISFLITKDFSKLDELIFSRQTVLLFSNELLDEFIEVARRPKFRRWFSQTDIERILETISEYANFIIIETETNACSDPKDNFLLSLSVDGNADFLITGDRDLLGLHKFGKTKIVTLTKFLEDH